MLRFAWMKNRLLFGLIALLLLGACSPLELERQNIPIIWGMRVNDAEDMKAIDGNVDAVEKEGLHEIFIELPLRADSMDLPILGAGISPSACQYMSGKHFSYQIGICTINEEELFPERALMSPKAWFSSLEEQIRGHLELLKIHLPKRVIIGSDLKPSYQYHAEWKQLFEGLRKDFPGILFSIGGRYEDLEKGDMIGISDELCVDYPPLVGEDLKSQSRELNAQIGKLALKEKKALYIFRANIMGPNPKIQIQNRFRFWPEALAINGICINSLTAKVPFADAKTYYGLADNPEAIAYLEAYQNKGAD